MDYERIHRGQTTIISPSKLRMKLIGPHHAKKKDGSNSNSARTSPSKHGDTEFVKNSLLTSDTEDFDDHALDSELTSARSQSEAILDASQNDCVSSQLKQALPKGKGDTVQGQMQQSNCESGNSNAIHPLRTPEDENLDYDSNASSSSFEFHKERSAHNQFTRSLSRPMSSKWNDAEKWIMSRQMAPQNHSKKIALHNQANRPPPVTNTVRVIPEFANYDPKSPIVRVVDFKREDFYQSGSQTAFDKFSFVPGGAHSVPTPCYGGNALIDQCTRIKDLKEVDQRVLSCVETPEEEATVGPVIRSVCMRDMGTEMTPTTSLEPSRSATPVGSTTPLRSPNSSIPSTPRRGALDSAPGEHGPDNSNASECGKRELTEQELKQKTRREIVALGVQLGKMNIAAWASKEDQEKNLETRDNEELQRIDYEKHAAAWEEAEKSKHEARYRREELKIQAWESRQTAKLEAELRKIEARVEQMRAHAHAKMVKKIAMTRQKLEEKRAAAEARKNRDAERTMAQAEYIRKTGQMPSTHYHCCSWW